MNNKEKVDYIYNKLSMKKEDKEKGVILDMLVEIVKRLQEVRKMKVHEIYECEICNKKYETEESADKCESDHKKYCDMAYHLYLERLEREKLEKAAAHPDQQKLVMGVDYGRERDKSVINGKVIDNG